jgi:hypothetical protein
VTTEVDFVELGGGLTAGEHAHYRRVGHDEVVPERAIVRRRTDQR